MIKYQLRCKKDHEFEGWFRSGADYDVQAEDGLLECPVCGSNAIEKAIMAPAVARKDTGKDSRRLADSRKSMVEAASRARDYVEKNFDYVGEKFPDEARKIHYGEAEARGIYGEATGKEVKELVDEGVEVAPMPGAKPKKKEPAARPAASDKPKKPLN